MSSESLVDINLGCYISHVYLSFYYIFQGKASSTKAMLLKQQQQPSRRPRNPY